MNLNDRNVLIQDLAKYLNISEDFVRRHVNDYSNHAGEDGVPSVPNLWRWLMGGNREGTEDDHRFFYGALAGGLYLFDLANFAEQFDPNTANARKYMRGRCLDYGCGIGTVSVFMASLPEVTLVAATDISTITPDFLSFRCCQHTDECPWLSKVEILTPWNTGRREPHKNLLYDEYDCIYVRDTFEHIIDRVSVLDELLKSLAPDGALIEATPIFNYEEEIGKENVAIKPYDIWDLLRDRGYELIEEAETGGFSQGTTKVWRKP